MEDISNLLWLMVGYILYINKRINLVWRTVTLSKLGFFIGIYSMQGWTATTRHEVTRKRSSKRLKYTGNLFRKNLQLYNQKMPVNSRLTATKIIAQKKAFCSQRIQEPSCARKETVDIDILVTSVGMVTKKSCNLSE